MAQLASPTVVPSEPSAKTGFLDLPGELRNQIYGYHLEQSPPMSDMIAMSTTCRVLREEYRPFLLLPVIVLPYYRVHTFLEAFFPESTPEIMQSYTCSIRSDVRSKCTKGDPSIDLKWLAMFLHRSPGVQITYTNDTKCSGRDELNWLLRVVKSNARWHDGIADFDSTRIPMEHRAITTDGRPEYKGLPFTIEFKIRTGAIDMSQWSTMTKMGPVDIRQGSGDETLKTLRHRLVALGLVRSFRIPHSHIHTRFPYLGARVYAKWGEACFMVLETKDKRCWRERECVLQIQVVRKKHMVEEEKNLLLSHDFNLYARYAPQF
ncbi:hypothetical protein T440DRAFT_474287 [Plenodomus tracheiphilus IPT5]|uniref:F-box domain-containing protein n=1 Tax=Plenodomus tracheiphilus IPT5 TaxID=1408161 RepID=A0A6A7BNC5_9PLEO|nr:hypothetical protein T440DRAFT_474287 [Plenodomus tracheiphilus IPT5]